MQANTQRSEHTERAGFTFSLKKWVFPLEGNQKMRVFFLRVGQTIFETVRQRLP